MPVRKRGDTWYYDFQIKGVRYRGAISEARLKSEAEEAEIKIRLSVFEGTYGKRQKSSQDLCEFINESYMPWAKDNKRSWRNDEYNSTVLTKYFRGKTFHEISPLLIEKFKSDRIKTNTKYDTKRKPASVNREIELLSRVLSMAVDNGLIDSNPCRKVKKLRMNNQRNRYLTVQEEGKLIAQFVDRRAYLKPIVIIALGTGMRRSEILSLRWSCVDFTRGLIHVTQTKTDRNRDIPMSCQVREALLDLQRKAEKDAQHVFPARRKGRCLVEIKKAFSAALDDAGITDFHFHDLRHTFATRLGDKGYNVTTIAALLGHTTIQMTARYTHATDTAKREAVEAVSAENQNPRHNGVTNEKQPPKLAAVN